jgi:hypothetical protein
VSFPPSAAVALGVLATAATVVLLQASAVWAALIAIGGVVVIVSFLVRDQQLYWLTLFLASVPLNIAKLLFFERDDLFRLRSALGLVVNEIDVAVLYICDLPLLVLAALLVAESLATRRRLVLPKAALVVTAFIVWCLGTLLIAKVPLLSVSWLIYQAKYLLVFLVVVNAVRTRVALRVVVAALVFGMALQGALSITTFVRQSGHNFYGSLFGPGEEEDATAPEETKAYLYVNEGSGLLRGSGTVGVSNETAKFIAPVLPLAMAGALVATTLAARAFFVVSFLVGAGGLVSTFSRGGLLAAGVAVAVLVILLAAKGLLARRAARLALAASVFGAALAAPVLARYLGSRPEYLSIRWEHLRYGLEALRDHPLVGVGINNFNVAFAPYDYGGVFREMAVHNHYLRIGVETGVVGMLLYFSFFFGVARLALRASRAADRSLATMATALLAAFIAIFFYWLDDLFYSVAFNTQLWVLAALPYVIAQLPPAGAPASPRPSPQSAT